MSLQLSQWAHCFHCMVSSSGDLTNSSQQAHCVSCKLTDSSQQAQGARCKLIESSQQAHSVSSSCEFTELTECPQHELAVSFSVSSRWVSCKLKFFTGFLINLGKNCRWVLSSLLENLSVCSVQRAHEYPTWVYINYSPRPYGTAKAKALTMWVCCSFSQQRRGLFRDIALMWEVKSLSALPRINFI